MKRKDVHSETHSETARPEEKASVQRSFVDRDKPGTLYLVATPIGNLEDMTFRAIRTLKEVGLIAAEDTRQTRKLLTHFDIAGRVVSYHEHNKEASGPELVKLLEEGTSIALVTDAGIPAISDPGAELAALAIGRGIPVVPIPGANAALSALIVSGLPTDRFLFVGFPPRDRKSLLRMLEQLNGEPGTLLFYESPHRIGKTLAVLGEKWAGRKMAIVRELTKKHEEVVRGTVESCLAHIADHPPLGECCLVVQGASVEEMADAKAASDATAWWSERTLEDHVSHYEASTGSRKEAMKLAAADRGMSRRDVYQQLLESEKRE